MLTSLKLQTYKVLLLLHLSPGTCLVLTNPSASQDFQFTIGQTQRMAAAFWYPVNGGSWQPYDHYSATCDWLPLELLPGAISKSENKSGTAFGTLSLLVSLASLAVAVAVAWWVRQSSKNSFVPINTTQL